MVNSAYTARSVADWSSCVSASAFGISSQQSLTRIHLIVLLHKAELFEPLLLGHGVVDEGARLLIRLTSSAADHAVDATVQHVEALLEKEISHISNHTHLL
ncbi:hypothetical protein EYF80_002778 [Liparis tanakae]|uniref:Uncharacterized protein n=1 Tax=Liparis tanakae TaxID=230148 RepID=A0A4Z2JB73_9TELE|nr:hypothetical protein EYF80_002778 [Liparis tanakae]